MLWGEVKGDRGSWSAGRKIMFNELSRDALMRRVTFDQILINKGQKKT